MESQQALERSPFRIQSEILNSLYQQDDEQFMEEEVRTVKMNSVHSWAKQSSKSSTASDRSDLYLFQDQFFREFNSNAFIAQVDQEEDSNLVKNPLYFSDIWSQGHCDSHSIRNLQEDFKEDTQKTNQKKIEQEVSQGLQQKSIHKVKGRSYKNNRIKGQNISDETKNIPKNYIKAIFSFIINEPSLLKQICIKINENKLQFAHLSSSQKLEFVQGQQSQFNMFIREQKKIKRYTIERLKQLWMHQRFGKLMRMASMQFLRKRSIAYVFQSKIQNKSSHIRHRHRLIEALSDPVSFNNLKL